MNVNTGIKQAVILAIGIIMLGFCIKSGLESVIAKDRKVVVKGLAEKEVEADKVTWPIVSKEIGNDLPELYQKINATTSTIRQFLLANGVKASEINVNAPVVIDLNAERYGENRQGYRYNITSIITVTSHNVKLVRGIIARQGDLLQKGVAIVDGGYENPVKYEYVAFRQMKPKMMQEAIENAEKTAAQFAENSKSNIFILHRILVATIHDGNALLEQVTLTGDDAANQFHVVRSNGDNRRDVIAIALAVFAISLSIEVDDHRGIDIDFICLHSICQQELTDGAGGSVDFLIELRQVVANLLGNDRPCHLISLNFLFCQSFHHLFAVFGNHTFKSRLDTKSKHDNANG